MSRISRRTLIAAAGAAPFAYALGGAVPASAATTAEAVALPAPAAHWAFDEGTGTTAADASGNGNTLTLGGKAVWGAAKSGAYSLDTTATGYAETVPAGPDGPAVDTSAAFSVAAWVRLARTDGYQTFVSADGKAVSAFFLQLRADTGTFAFTRLPADSTDANNAAAVAGATFAPEAGTWYHLLGVDDPSAKTVRLYVDGVLEGEADYSGGWQNPTGTTAVGRGFYGGAKVDQAYALIDEASLYATALTAEQAAALAGADPADTAPLLTIDTATAGPTVSPDLGGIFFEDINHSGEGGLYAELVNNRSFMAAATPLHWSATGSGAISIDKSTPLNTALTQSLKLTVTAPGDGISNEGFWGIPVRPRTTYRASLWAKGTYRGRLTVALTGKDGTVYATGTTKSVTGDWTQYELKLRTTASAPTTADATLTVTTSSSASDTVWFSNVSLFPPTYNNRPNGLRVDLVEKLAALDPKFLRFPGGNYLEGNVIADRFDWKKTIGAVEERPGHQNSAWGYWSTDGLGLLEYLELTEDLGCAPLLCVFAGYALHGAYVTGDALKPFVQDALDEIEYLTGSTATTWGARRAADGHPKPFPLTYVEIGNEDWFDTSGSYEERYAAFHDAIKAAHPHLKLIATTPVSSRPYDLIDEHYYQSPSAFQHGAHKYDNRDRTTPKVFVGEWASQGGRPTPDLNSALGDASWLTGLIRNSDQVLMESYAPLFSHVSNNVWATNLIAYDALTSYNSPSYYAQQILRTHQGTVVAPTTARALPGLNTVTTRDPRSGRLYAAVVNFGSVARTTSVEITGARKIKPAGRATVLAGTALTDTNTLTDPEKLTPHTRRVTGLAAAFTYTFPPFSVTVLEVDAPR
ncbi:alpha-L-arabinofuranosidase C-terminal domain-containing protein [Streptomyces beijiangensis]|uniref:non-reducing end alpha-L-arabinofuranosidase n=1 Tax=Streptomyces beijiangensis TaxID=163361 RepID=A0A939JHE7_9ACTN|nr:alpha-L-arabinofuranosidase C-terminal domain-containing protein [Streptomyces beijiangensis]MBO0514398.1 carbohydrate binding domain-containing protein [Streptomyces beijiangensis]